MPLTDAQLPAFKAHLLADPVYAAALAAGDDTGVAALANGAASPVFRVYRASVPMSEIMLNGFDWTRVDNLSVGKARIWDWMVNADQSRAIDPRKPNVRAGVNAVWVGTTADLAVRAAVYAHCSKVASRAEKLYATGAGTAPDANGDGPGVTALESPVTDGDVARAKALPA
jgi:hypothetical protein